MEPGEQGALFRNTDPDTSRDAAASVDCNQYEWLVLKVLYLENGATIKAVTQSANRPEVSISPRFRPLAEKGLIYDTGERRTNPSGRKAILWKLTLAGLKLIERAWEKHERQS